jgi:uncharacterized protein YecE (DUF72 family)
VVVKIGTSGWQYRHWRDAFYPHRLPTREWLGYYVASFDTVELNNAFYRLPDAEQFERWAAATPDGFEMAVKASSYLTHNKRLRQPRRPVERLMAHASHLGPRLGPVLLQLPPTMRSEPARLDEALACFAPGVRVAVEARHDSWDCDEVWSVLQSHDAAWCVADAPWRRWPVVRTASWGYLRFHEGRASPRPCYGRGALHSWAERVATLWGGGEDVYAYFNNDACGCALRDARAFAATCRNLGLATTKVPRRGAVHLCRQ